MNNSLKNLLLIAISSTVVSCGGEDITGTGNAKQELRNFSDFSGIDVSGNYQIQGGKGSPEKFIITTNENLLPYILTSVKSGVLIVEDKKNVTLHPSVKQYINFTVPNFNSLTLSGASSFRYQDISTNQLDINLSGAHNVVVTGKAQTINITISGNSDVDARNLSSIDANIDISGSSTVYINPEKSLNVKINGNGKVVYFSQAPKIEQSISGFGQVISNFGPINK